MVPIPLLRWWDAEHGMWPQAAVALRACWSLPSLCCMTPCACNKRRRAGLTLPHVLFAGQGSLVRVVRREEELLRQLVAAARSVGEEALAAKFEDCIAKIKRGIIFAASLYL